MEVMLGKPHPLRRHTTKPARPPVSLVQASLAYMTCHSAGLARSQSRMASLKQDSARTWRRRWGGVWL